MTVPTRTPGRYGRRAPKNAPALELRSFLRAGVTIPPHPATEDYLAALANWAMLGNDSAGDCVAVTWSNFRRLVTTFLSTEVYPSQAQVWEIYKTQNPQFDPNGDPNVNGPGSQADGGMDIQTLLEYLVTRGGPDGVKAVAFAKVDFGNTAELQAALAIFGGVWTGINVTEANQTEFGNDEPWDYVASSPVDGGHSVLTGGYTPLLKFITWAEETTFSASFVQHQVEEAWIVVWPEHLGTKEFEAGIDGTALATAFQELTGKPFPVQPTPAPPVPAPSPVPVPAPPVPTPAPVTDVHFDSADYALADALGPWLNEHHIGVNAHAVRDINTWLNAKNAVVA